MQTKNMPIGEVKAGPDDGLNEGEFIVYPSTFIREPDSYGDVIAKSAFDNTIQSWKDSGNTLPGLFGHRLDDPDYYVAYALDMGVDEHGWWVKGAFDLDSPKGRHVYRLVKGRRLSQLSFAFDVVDSEQVELDGGVKARELREVRIYEFSFVPVGANQDTSVVAVKAMADAVRQDLKAGRVLSSKNEESLRSAYEAIGQVLESIAPMDLEKANDDDASRKSEASQSTSVAPPQDIADGAVAFFEMIQSLKGVQ